jgi:hypothetical protein
VSNINGGPLDKDCNGFISEVSRGRKMLQTLKKGSSDMDVIDKGCTAVVPRMLKDAVIAYSVD